METLILYKLMLLLFHRLFDKNTILYVMLVLECDKGSYGLECKETCGHCRDVNQCSNVDGTCITGCAAGFEGNLCKTRE